jgi:hypothetical protein
MEQLAGGIFAGGSLKDRVPPYILLRWRACVIRYEGSCVGIGLIKIRDNLGTRIRD